MKKLATELEEFFEPKVFELQRVYEEEYNNRPSFFIVKIIDHELDPYECILGTGDSNIEIRTEDYTHVSLTKRHLQILIDLLDEVEDIERDDVEYKEWENKKENKKYIDKL